MKYLKKFEHFTGYDLGRFSEEEELLNQPKLDEPQEDEDEYCAPCEDDEMEDELEDEMELKPRVWGDGVVEGKKAKPDFLDLDKDGNKKESMKKAAKDAKDSKKDDKKEDEKGGKGLSKAQQKLPAGLRKAIEAKNKKK